MPAWVVPAAIAAGGALINMAQNWRARRINENYVRDQNSYNSPAAQMARYRQAGLNPHLIYGQGNPGNQSQNLTAPDMRGGTDAVQSYNQSRLADTQQAVGEARVEQTRAMKEVNNLQADVLRRNPMLNDSYFLDFLDAMKSTAREKALSATSAQLRVWYEEATKQTAASKMFREVEMLEKQLDLLSKDEAIKGEVLKSKQFENAMLEVQQRFVTDGDIGPQQIMEFLRLFLSRIKAR